MGVLGKDLLDFHRPRTNTKVEFGACGYWVESHPTMPPYGAVLTEILNLDAPPLHLYRFIACIGMTFSCLQAWMCVNYSWEKRRKRSANM